MTTGLYDWSTGTVYCYAHAAKTAAEAEQLFRDRTDPNGLPPLAEGWEWQVHVTDWANTEYARYRNGYDLFWQPVHVTDSPRQ